MPRMALCAPSIVCACVFARARAQSTIHQPIEIRSDGIVVHDMRTAIIPFITTFLMYKNIYGSISTLLSTLVWRLVRSVCVAWFACNLVLVAFNQK